MEEVEGFEPPRAVKPLSVFKTDPFSRTWVYLHIVIIINGAEDRNRTGTVVTYRRILSPVRLPVPPPRQHNYLERKTGFEPATPTLARLYSTPEPLAHIHPLG